MPVFRYKQFAAALSACAILGWGRSASAQYPREILHISHAHWDHNAGSAALKAATGAQYFVMDADVPVVESGGRSDYQ